MKALGTGIVGVGWRDIEVLSNADGKPSVGLNGRAREKAEELSMGELAVSLSHSREYAIASVVGVRIEDRHRRADERA
jgi:holo-[acyl-carrier protein] synthase